MSVQSKMTAIADPIRTLTGATGTLSLDQMATKLTDANTAKAAILTALSDKGVTTTGSEGIDEIAALVAGIETGGGGIEVESGTFILTEEVTGHTVEFSKTHSETAGIFAAFVTPDEGDGSRVGLRVLLLSRRAEEEYKGYSYGYMSNQNLFPYNPSGLIQIYNADKNIKVSAYGGGGYVRANERYTWIAIFGATL